MLTVLTEMFGIKGSYGDMIFEPALLPEQFDKDGIASVSFEFNGKPQLLLMYSADLAASGKNAQNDIKEAAKFIQGGGGGQPGFASAGGKDVSGLKAAFDTLLASATK